MSSRPLDLEDTILQLKETLRLERKKKKKRKGNTQSVDALEEGLGG